MTSPKLGLDTADACLSWPCRTSAMSFAGALDLPLHEALVPRALQLRRVAGEEFETGIPPAAEIRFTRCDEMLNTAGGPKWW